MYFILILDKTLWGKHPEPSAPFYFLSYSDGNVSALWKVHFSAASRARTSGWITCSPFSCPENRTFQISGLHSVSRSHTYMCVLVLELIVELTEQWCLSNTVSERNNKLDQNLTLQPCACCRSSREKEQAYILNSKLPLRCWSCFQGKLTHSVLSRIWTVASFS